MDVLLEMPYSLDLRVRAVAAVHSGMQKMKVCNLFNIFRKILYSRLALENEQGYLAPQIGFQKGHGHGINDLDKFLVFVDLYPDYTQEEMALHYSVGSSIIGRAMVKIGYARKKEPNILRKE